MRRALLSIWSLPWPPWLRRWAGPLAMNSLVQQFAVPHFRCGVVGLMQNQRGEFLLLRHTYRGKYPWGLPTGFMEHGEQPAEALRREIREETGFSVQAARLWRVYTDNRSIINVVYRGEVQDGSFSSNAEISAAAFFGRGNLPALMPEQRLLLEAVQEEDQHTESA